MPSDILSLFSDPECVNVSKEVWLAIVQTDLQSKNFWLLVKALQTFQSTSASGLLPLSSTLPDMHSSTTSYIALQTLYRDQTRADVESFNLALAKTLQSVGLPEDAIAQEEVDSFVKNCHHLKVVRGSPLTGDLTKELAVVGALSEVLDMADFQRKNYRTIHHPSVSPISLPSVVQRLSIDHTVAGLGLRQLQMLMRMPLPSRQRFSACTPLKWVKNWQMRSVTLRPKCEYLS